MVEGAEASLQTTEYQGFTINLPQQVVEAVENEATLLIQEGRMWDIDHTKAVVFYALEIGLTKGLDLAILYTAAWFHDSGYANLFEGDASTVYDEVKNRKALHMEKGAENVRKFLEQEGIRDFFSQQQKEMIIYLVANHDRLDQITSIHSRVLIEADTLGAIDVERVKPTFGYDDAMWYIETELTEVRFPLFRTQIGTAYYWALLPAFEKYYDMKKPQEM